MGPLASIPPGHDTAPSSPAASSSGGHRSDFFKIWTSTIPMLILTVASITANGAVLFMFASRQGLRRYKNVYIASLALADFLVGLSMPVKMTFDLNYSWPAQWPCRIFQSLRQAVTYVSFLSIFLIILDKWRAVHYPMSYRGKKSKRLALAAVIVVWILAFIVYAVPLIWWDTVPLPARYDSRYRKLTNAQVYENQSGSGDQGSSRSGSDNITISIPLKTRSNTDKSFCYEGFHLQSNISILSTVVLYIIPLLIMLVFNLSVYFKIKWRKSVEVQRSTSVTDTYFMTLKKPPLDIESCVNSGGAADDPAKEALLKNPDSKPINKHLAVAARGERRHSSLPAISPVIKGRTSSGRRVSMPEGNTTGGGCRYVGRKWSGCVSNMSGNTSPNPMANLGPRLQNEDLVHDILLKKDKKIARCLCLMLAVLVACWLPHAVVNLVNAQCACVRIETLIATSWLCLLSHGVNPFLYVLMMAHFKNILKQWLLVERVHAFKMRDTLILKNLQRKIASEEDSNTKDKSPLPSTKEAQFHLPDIEKTENSSV